MPAPKMNQEDSKAEAKTNPILKDFIKVLLMPLLVNKVFMMYFGLHYSNFPGEGYGYGLVATLIIMFVTIGRFIWKYRDVEDP